MRRAIAAVTMLALGVAAGAPAHAQESSVLSDPRLAAVRPRLSEAVEAAERDGLPPAWLLDKVAEGLSKHVPPPLIARAVDTLLSRMRAADGMVRDVPGVRGRARRRLLRVAVDALSAGAPAEGVGRLVREAARGDRAGAAGRVREALVTVAELAERDFSGPAAVQAARDAYRGGQRRGLGELLRRARRIPPGAARDDTLRDAGRGIGRGGVDRPGSRGDHGRRGPPSVRGRPR